MISVILCGGAGSRLWPVSRERHPKPFIRLADGRSLIQGAFLHAAALPRTREIITLTSRKLHFKIEDEMAELNLSVRHSYILEPFGRNTAPAIAAAALEVARRYGRDALMLVLAADHLIADKQAFIAAVEEAGHLAEEGRLVTFGIQPTGPETGFGYIEADGSDVLRFVEKPAREKAEQYCRAGNFFWNSGMFCFKAGTFLSEMNLHAPELLAAMEKCLEKSAEAAAPGQAAVELSPDEFSLAPDISIDYALMEKSDKVSVVPCDMGWNDIGSWTALFEIEAADENGNHLRGQNMTLKDVRGCDILGGQRLVAALGVEDLLIVDTSDALLVAHKSRAQEVKDIYSDLKAKDHDTYKHHRTIYRPWGSYTLLEMGPRFKIKRLEIKPGASISLQLHHHRSEHWIVVSGMAEVVCGDKTFFVDTNESTYIKAGHKHRVSNHGLMTLVMIEVQSGDYLGEDDIVRFDDIYGRVDSGDR